MHIFYLSSLPTSDPVVNVRFTVVMILSLLYLLLLAGFIFVVILIMKALLKYLKSSEVRKEKATVCRSLGEALKEHRIRCHMTQEFVAERLGVSRQAVSKWENGTSDPSTSNLLALAKLYDISPEELLRQAQPNNS